MRSAAAVGVMVSVNTQQEMYEQMVTARHYEQRLQEEYLEGKQPAFDISAGPIPGELHLAAPARKQPPSASARTSTTTTR